MLRNNPDVDVFTTMAETEMLELQDSTQANRDNLEKMERSVFNEAGMSKNLFASDGTTALEYSQKVDMALAYDISKMFATFLSYHANRKFPDKKFFLEVSIMRTISSAKFKYSFSRVIKFSKLLCFIPDATPAIILL